MINKSCLWPNRHRTVFYLLPLLMATGCSFMPSTGPHASLLLDPKYNNTPVVDVTDQLAASMQAEVQREQIEGLQRVLQAITVPVRKAVILEPGDIVHVALWSQATNSDTGLANVPHAQDLGPFPVGIDGAVNLPWAGHVHVAGLSTTQAETAIARRYSSLDLFPQTVASLQVTENHKQNVVVMGAVNQPTVLNWSEGGIDLDEAVAKAGGFHIFDPGHEGTDVSVNNVLVIRDGVNYNLPLRTALAQQVPLHPGDRVVLQHEPVVRALCLGAGWKIPTIVPFDTAPTLAEVLAKAGDMNSSTAQGRAIFVFKHDKKIIYRVNFDTADGMQAAQKFPINDRDLVYIPPSRSVTLQQIVSIIMSVGYPAAMGAAI